jgi:hypothetical protein
MADIYLKVLLIMAVLFAFMVPGFALKKLKMIGEGGTLTLSNLLLYVCQPALAIKAFCVFSEEDWELIKGVNKLTLLKNFGFVAIITVVSMLLMFAICKLVFIKAKDKKSADVYSYIAIFYNCGFLGIPFIEMFTDGNPIAVIYMMVFSVVFNILCWTLGVYLITGDFKEISIKKILLNPVIIANVLGVIIFFVPQINIFMFEGLEELQTFPKYLAYMTAPLSMVIVGIRLAESNPKDLFAKKGVYLAGVLRLVVAPFLTIAITIPFWGILGSGAESYYEEYVYMAPIIAMAMSPAASVVAMAERFNGDKDTATAAFVTNTIISIITIPLVITAATMICGVAV